MPAPPAAGVLKGGAASPPFDLDALRQTFEAAFASGTCDLEGAANAAMAATRDTNKCGLARRTETDAPASPSRATRPLLPRARRGSRSSFLSFAPHCVAFHCVAFLCHALSCNVMWRRRVGGGAFDALG